MNLEQRLDRLERLLSSQMQHPDWVTPKVASDFLNISARRLVQMYDSGDLPRDCARQINKSTQRRRLLFNLKQLQASIGGPVLA